MVKQPSRIEGQCFFEVGQGGVQFSVGIYLKKSNMMGSWLGRAWSMWVTMSFHPSYQPHSLQKIVKIVWTPPSGG